MINIMATCDHCSANDINILIIIHDETSSEHICSRCREVENCIGCSSASTPCSSAQHIHHAYDCMNGVCDCSNDENDDPICHGDVVLVD